MRLRAKTTTVLLWFRKLHYVIGTTDWENVFARGKILEEKRLLYLRSDQGRNLGQFSNDGLKMNMFWLMITSAGKFLNYITDQSAAPNKSRVAVREKFICCGIH